MNECVKRVQEAARSARLRDKDLEEFKLKSLAHFRAQLPSMINQALETSSHMVPPGDSDQLKTGVSQHATFIHDLQKASEYTERMIKELQLLSNASRQKLDELAQAADQAARRSEAAEKRLQTVNKNVDDYTPFLRRRWT